MEHTLKPTDTQDLQELAASLQTQRHELVDQLRLRLHQADDPQELSLVASDAADAGQFSATEITQLNHELAELRDVDAALARLRARTYGRCARCGDVIPGARLRAQPAATLCLACQDDSERADAAHPHRGG